MRHDNVARILEVYKQRNGGLPLSIVVYRDGVSEGAFKLVLETAICSIYAALNQRGDVGTTICF